MSDLTAKIDKVNNFIGKKGHDISSFIYFYVNEFELDTRDPNSFKHYAISFENQKTGVGQGNQFTLKIAFHRDFSYYESINAFEKALGPLARAAVNLDVADYKNSDVKNKCILKYGYLSSEEGLMTEEYVGMLIEYKVTANKQIVEYTLKGITGEEVAIGNVNWYPRVKGMEEDADGVLVAELMSKKEAEGLTEAENSELLQRLNDVYTGPITCNPYDALRLFIEDYNDEVTKIAEENNSTATTFEIKLGKYDNMPLATAHLKKLRNVIISLCRNQTPIDYIEYLISMFDETQGKDYALSFVQSEQHVVRRWVYELKRDKKNYNVMQVVINSFSSDASDVYDYHFKGYSPDNNLLIDYNLTYDGTVALAISDSMTQEKDNNIYIDSRGQLQTESVITKDMFVQGALDEVQVKEQNTWLDKISCANNCTITTFGLPFEIPVSAIFRVTMYINDTPHHTSGRCYVVGVVDKIDNGQFTTTISMIRLPGKEQDLDI